MASTATADFDVDKVTSQVVDLFAHGATLKDIHGYSDQEFDALYALGYNLYNQGKFGEALQAFGWLLMHDQLERKYYKAFGSCLQMLKRYEEAVRNYSMASILDLTDPEPTFHTAECMVALGMPKEAIEALEMVLLDTKDKPDYQVMNQRARAMIELLGKAPGGAE
ncbi:MAG TPA: SycD/LcrH family type III secretion system chaperone [Usitatibacter sp.]|nr:SycD/LcrH family type III secretion system chaperone [Usitatibacter sp.]